MLKILYRFIILSFLILYIKTDPSEEYRCVDNTSDKLKVGENVILCVHIISKKKKEKVGIRIKVDEYSVVSIEGILDKYKELKKQFKNDDFSIELLAQIGNVTSVFTSVSLN
jgi:hypothetical protein